VTPAAFAAALRDRGIELVCPGNRIRVWPRRAYGDLTLEERQYINRHRAELKALMPFPEATVKWVPGAKAKAQPDLRCPFCLRVPCIGPDHEHFALLHALDPAEQQRQRIAQQKHDSQQWEDRRRHNLPVPRWP
jgi:hypothetical protein